MRIDGAAVTANEPELASQAVASTIDDPPPTATGSGLTRFRTSPGQRRPAEHGVLGRGRVQLAPAPVRRLAAQLRGQLAACRDHRAGQHLVAPLDDAGRRLVVPPR